MHNENWVVKGFSLCETVSECAATYLHRLRLSAVTRTERLLVIRFISNPVRPHFDQKWNYNLINSPLLQPAEVNWPSSSAHQHEPWSNYLNHTLSHDFFFLLSPFSVRLPHQHSNGLACNIIIYCIWSRASVLSIWAHLMRIILFERDYKYVECGVVVGSSSGLALVRGSSVCGLNAMWRILRAKNAIEMWTKMENIQE